MATTAPTLDDIEAGARTSTAWIRYLGDGDYVTRRYVSQGAEINTGEYFDHEMPMRDAMPIRDHFTLDTHGFVLGQHQSAVADFNDTANVDALYPTEVAEAVKALSGASFVAVQGWMRRTRPAASIRTNPPGMFSIRLSSRSRICSSAVPTMDACNI